jgi:hypothetical protein
VHLAPENALPDRPQRLDRPFQVAVDGDVADPGYVVAECFDLEVAATVVVGVEPTTVPGAMVDLDVEPVGRQTQIRVDRLPVAEFNAALPLH